MSAKNGSRTNSCRVWAPRAERVELVLFPDQERVAMSEARGGHFEVRHPRIVPGQRYAFSLDGGPPLPDPRSEWQPEGIDGPSAWVDFDAFELRAAAFRQVPLERAVIYELHTGTFSREGTFDGVVAHLPHLVELGITHVELMPVAHFPGTRGWGYDGVFPFAPHTAYGGPEGLARLVDACHQAGIAVLLDVVYNHLGPSGNVLGRFGPYFTSKYRTPWGDAFNFDDRASDEPRRFVCDNALHWLERYRIDGLRLDAVHAIFDQSATPILAQLASEVSALSSRLDRPLVLIAESELNDPRFVRNLEFGGSGLDSQWADDLHHALHSLLTGERSGYYRDFGSLARLASALRHGFAFQGEYSRHRDRSYGAEPRGLTGRHFVVCSQNHDQVGNRAQGDRPSQTLSPGQLRIASALVLLSPFVPLLFMGEEWGTQTPFQYFTDHREPELAQAVRDGRRREFAAFGWSPESVPDPQDPWTFQRSRLDWSEVESRTHAEMLDWYRALLALRRGEPSLRNDALEQTHVAFDEEKKWLTLQRGTVIVACNFSTHDVELETRNATLLLASGPQVALRPTMLYLPPRSVAVLRAERRRTL